MLNNMFMKNLKNILLTILFSIIMLGLFFTISDGKSDPNNIEALKGFGNLFLFIVTGFIGLLMFSALLVIPRIIYLRLKKEIKISELIIEYTNTILIIVGSISLLSIAGVQLRSLKKTDTPAEVRIVEPNGKPKVNHLVPFYFNDSIGDWIEINEESFDQHRKMNHISYYFKTSSEYYKKINGVWCPIPRNIYNGYLKTGKLKVRKLTPIPKVEYLVWTVNKWESVTKDKFIEYRKSDSIVSFKQVYE